MRMKCAFTPTRRGQSYNDSKYFATMTDVDAIVNAKFLQDGKSIAEAQTEIEL